MLYQINLIHIVFLFCKSTENRHVPAPSFCFRRTTDTFPQALLQVLIALSKLYSQLPRGTETIAVQQVGVQVYTAVNKITQSLVGLLNPYPCENPHDLTKGLSVSSHPGSHPE